MTKDEMLALRKRLQIRVEELRQIGDYGAGATDIRLALEAQLAVVNHLAERLKG